MTAAIALISAAVPDTGVEPYPEPPRPGVCCLTGQETDTIARKHLLGASFTQWDMLARPESDRIGVAVWRAWTYGEVRDGKKRRYCPERMSSWIVTDQAFRPLDRREVRDLVLGGGHDAGRWAGYATTSYKKHGSLLAPVNPPGPGVWLWETRRVDCSDHDQVLDWWRRLRAWQDVGIPRPVLETVDPEPHLIRKVGPETAQAFVDWAWPRRMGALYQFLCYLLPSQDELKEAKDAATPAIKTAPAETPAQSSLQV